MRFHHLAHTNDRLDGMRTIIGFSSDLYQIVRWHCIDVPFPQPRLREQCLLILLEDNLYVFITLSVSARGDSLYYLASYSQLSMSLKLTTGSGKRGEGTPMPSNDLSRQWCKLDENVIVINPVGGLKVQPPHKCSIKTVLMVINV